MNPALKHCLPATRRALLVALACCGAFGATFASAGAADAQGLNFTSTAPVGRAYTPASRMVLADFNGDGKADLATAGYVNGNASANNIYLQVYLGDGQGGFATSPSAFANVNGCAAIQGLAAFGLDTGGSLNLALLCSDTLQIWRVQNNGASAARPVSLTSNPANRQVMLLDSLGKTLAITDLFGVGSAGVVVMEAGSDYYNHVVAYYGPDCSGAACTDSSMVPQLKTTPILLDFSSLVDAHERGVGVVAVPQPGSTTPALVYATKADSVCGGSIVSQLPQPDGSSFVTGSIATINAGLCTSAIATGDVTQDGAPALVLGGLKVAQGNHPETGFVSIYTGFSDGGFSFEETHTENVYAPVDSAGLTVVDLNGDGNADIIVGGPYTQGVSAQADSFSIYLGQPDGTFVFSQNAGADTSGGGSRYLGTGIVALGAGNINTDGAPDLETIDLIGDGSGGGVGNIQQLTGTNLQLFPPRSLTTTVSLTAGTAFGLGGGGGGGERRSVNSSNVAPRPKPNYYGPQATTQLTATVTPADATGSVQFFDATTQTWAGTAPVVSGTARITLYGTPGHLFVASYYGDATYVGSSSDAVPAVVAKQTPNVYLSINPNPAAPTDTISFTVYVSGNSSTPSGVVGLVDDNTGNLLTSVTLDSGGSATAQLTLPAGSYDVVANYLGDGAYNTATSSDVTLTVAVPLVPDTLTLAATPPTTTYGSTVSATATLMSSGNATPTGTVQFRLDGVQVATAAISQGVASATITPGPGRHRLQAFYAGDGTSTPAVSNAVPLTTHGGALQFFPAAATTFAGVPATTNTSAFAGDGGPATAARFHTPFGLAWDGGNLYIADEQNNVIRKVAADGTITTVAGSQYVGNYNYGRYSGDGGPATSAGMTNPAAVALDSAGNLFIADYSNNVVRRVDALTGIITTFAGTTSSNYITDNGPATSVKLNNPVALAFDAANNLYIADSHSNLVRKVDSAGNLTTVAGHYGYYGAPTYGQPATNSPLNQPGGVAVDAAGNLYIADTGNNVISKVDTSGIVTVFAGGSTSYAPNQGDGGLATAATLNRPGQLAMDAAGNLYIADTINNTVRKVDRSGIITTVAGSTSIPSGGPYDPAGTPATSAPLIADGGVAVDASGNLFVANTGNQTVWRVGPAGALIFGPQNSGTTSDAQIITVENNGDQSINFNATPFTITGDYVLSSEGSAPCVFTAALAPGSNCTIALRYKPVSAPGNGSVVFATDSAGSPTINLIVNTSRIATAVDLQLYPGDTEIGQDLLLYATVSSAANKLPPGGTFSFFEGTTLLGTSLATTASGASYGYVYLNTLPLGGHDITAAYSGDSLYAGSTSASQHMTVTKIATTIALSVSNSAPAYGDSVTLTATLTSTTTSAPLGQGSIAFTDGGVTLATVNVGPNGVATFTTSSLVGGSHTLQARYVGQGNYAASVSNTVAVQVSGGTGGGGGGLLDYTIQASGLPVVIHRGETATVQLLVTAVGYASGSVPLSCGTLPSYATCSFSPAVLNFNGQTNQQQTVTWTIQTTPASAGTQSQQALQIKQVAGRGMPRIAVKR